MSRLLVGETQEDFASALQEYFTLEHYSVQIESQGLRLLECLQEAPYDVVAIEMTMPGLDAIGIVRGYRASGGSTPILLMSSKHSSEELQAGLDAGADAYLAKPFKLIDLAAHFRALLRRPTLRTTRVLLSGGIALDTNDGTVTKNNTLIHLHPMEFKLLHFLLSHPNQVFSQHAIFLRVWQKESPGQLEDTVRTHIRTLRRKIDSDDQQSIITTVRGQGYKAEIR